MGPVMSYTDIAAESGLHSGELLHSRYILREREREPITATDRFYGLRE